MGLEAPTLPYDYSALEPHIDEETMKVHHSKHHAAYVKGLLALSSATPTNASLYNLLRGLDANDGLTPADKAVLENHGGGHYNHSLFWLFMAPVAKAGEARISAMLRDRIEMDFKSLDAFKEEFGRQAAKVFGSGWCWWVFDQATRTSRIETTPNQRNPVMANPSCVCLLGLDVWEHAYYLKHQNVRAQYIDCWWNVVNWEFVSRVHDELAVAGKGLELTESGHVAFPEQEGSCE